MREYCMNTGEYCGGVSSINEADLIEWQVLIQYLNFASEIYCFIIDMIHEEISFMTSSGI